MPELNELLLLLTAFCPVLSGVEQNCSLAQWALEGLRAWLSDQLENEELKLLCDHRSDEEEALINQARIIWVRSGFGKPRASGPLGRAPRSDAGVKRGSGDQEGTEAHFIKRRRLAVDAALQGNPQAQQQAAGEVPLPRSSQADVEIWIFEGPL